MDAAHEHEEKGKTAAAAEEEEDEENPPTAINAKCTKSSPVIYESAVEREHTCGACMERE